MAECPACKLEMLKTVAAERPSYVLGMAADGALWGVWKEHGATVKGYVSVMLVHLEALPDKTFGRDGWATEWRQDVFTEQLMDIQNYPRSESVRTRDWKYIRYFARTEDPQQSGRPFRGTLDDYNECLASTLKGEKPAYEELFDLKNDPGEVENRAADPQCADRLEQLRARLLELAREKKGDDRPPLTVSL